MATSSEQAKTTSSKESLGEVKKSHRKKELSKGASVAVSDKPVKSSRKKELSKVSSVSGSSAPNSSADKDERRRALLAAREKAEAARRRAEEATKKAEEAAQRAAALKEKVSQLDPKSDGSGASSIESDPLVTDSSLIESNTSVADSSVISANTSLANSSGSRKPQGETDKTATTKNTLPSTSSEAEAIKQPSNDSLKVEMQEIQQKKVKVEVVGQTNQANTDGEEKVTPPSLKIPEQSHTKNALESPNVKNEHPTNGNSSATTPIPMIVTPDDISAPVSALDEAEPAVDIKSAKEALAQSLKGRSRSHSAGESKAPVPLTHITKLRVKPNQNRRGSSKNPVRNRPGAYKSAASEAKRARPGYGTETPVALHTLIGRLKPAGRPRAQSAKYSQDDIANEFAAIEDVMLTQNRDESEPKGPLFDPNSVLQMRRGSNAAAKPPPTPKLIRISGKNRIHVRQVEISALELNQGNVFVLNSLDSLWIWNGTHSNKMERTTALDVVTRINRSEFGGRAKVVNFKSGEESPEFWEKLGGKKEIQSEDVGHNFRELGKEWDATDSLYLYDVEQQEFVLVEDQRTQDRLKNDRSFVLDCTTEFYVWHGKRVAIESKAAANAKADALFQSKPRPPWCTIQRANQGGESILFISKFFFWTAEATLAGSEEVSGNIAKSKFDTQEKMDVERMHTIEPPVSGKMFHDGVEGRKVVWTVDGGGKKEVPESEYGQFNCNKSYIVLYNWLNNSRFHLYFWQGHKSTINEKGTSAGVTMDINVSMCGNTASLERVIQFKEPNHFLAMFQDSFVDPSQAVRLYQGRGSTPYNASLVQVALDSALLCSKDVFVLVRPKHRPYLWVGQQATPFLRADHIRKITAKFTENEKIEIITEGQEPSEFWKLLGGKKEYHRPLPSAFPVPKLFYCDNKLGTFRADRMFVFTWNPYKQAILDLGPKVYVWLGRESKHNDRKLALELATEYVAASPKERGKAFYVLQGSEPLEFRAAFLGFPIPPTPTADGYGPIETLLKEYNQSFTYQQLKDKSSLPPFVDKSRLEEYLSETDFLEVFGCSRAEFKAKPNWKSVELKRQKGLY